MKKTLKFSTKGSTAIEVVEHIIKEELNTEDLELIHSKSIGLGMAETIIVSISSGVAVHIIEKIIDGIFIKLKENKKNKCEVIVEDNDTYEDFHLPDQLIECTKHFKNKQDGEQ